MESAYPPGSIKFKQRYKQLNDFSGILRRRGITPTDIDGVIDYNGKAFFFLEGKHEDAQMPNGQKIALQNIVDAIQETGREAILVLYTHSHSPDQIVDVALQVVTMFYYKKQWNKPKKQQTTVLYAVEAFESFCEQSKNLNL